MLFFVYYFSRTYVSRVYIPCADLEEGVGGVGVRTPPLENSNYLYVVNLPKKALDHPSPTANKLSPSDPPPPKKISGSAHVYCVQCKFYVLPILSEFLTHF